MWLEIIKVVLKTLNLLIFFYLIYYFARKPVKEFLENYKKEILLKREEAKKKEKEAKRIEEEAKYLREKLAEELDTIKIKFEELKKETKEEMEKETEKFLDKLKKQFERDLKESEERIKKEILTYARNKIMDQTQDILKRTLDDTERERFVLKILEAKNE
ncbi:MAG: hypothetical protein WHV67_00615 [Thermoanaerobaculia bacterium]